MDIVNKDEKIFSIIEKELVRQQKNIELIASENYVSKGVMAAQGSILTNKYAEGYPGRRYYGGCEYVDEIENTAIERAKLLFDANYANVQPHSGSSANMAAYRVLLNSKDRVLGMALDHGGHLTHGHPLSFSGKDYNFEPYYVNKETEIIDYEALEQKAKEYQPHLIVAGASAYSQEINFARIKEIADLVGAKLMVDMAHIAGLIAVGLHQNPVPYADVVTSTTHKTLRGPRGGLILSNDKNIMDKINRWVFPGIQGGPLMHVIAAKAVSFYEALDEDFIKYQKQVIENAKTLADELMKKDVKLVTNGTDNHLLLVDVKSSYNLTGKEAENILGQVNITCNKNMIPNDTEKPFITSGIRLGTPAITTRGMKEKEMKEIAIAIDTILRDSSKLDLVKNNVLDITKEFPLYEK